MRVRLAQPAENLPANRVGQGFVDRVDIGVHLGSFKVFDNGSRDAGGRRHICIATTRIIYRNLTICLKALLAVGRSLWTH
jgi:hypothetical protein